MKSFAVIALASIMASANAFSGPTFATKVVAKKAAAKAPAPAAPKADKNPFLKATPADPNLLGALPPVGFFDPAGFSASATPEQLARYREVEIMHGRFAQMATLGVIVAEKQASSGNYDAAGSYFLAPNGCAIDVFTSDPGWTSLTLALIALLEGVRLVASEPGNRVDAGIESIGWRPKDPEEFVNMQIRELQNGRLAMLAFAGQIAQELVNHTPLLVHLQNENFVSF